MDDIPMNEPDILNSGPGFRSFERDDGYESPGTFSSDVTTSSSTSGNLNISQSYVSNEDFQYSPNSRYTENSLDGVSARRRPETLPGLDNSYLEEQGAVGRGWALEEQLNYVEETDFMGSCHGQRMGQFYVGDVRSGGVYYDPEHGPQNPHPNWIHEQKEFHNKIIRNKFAPVHYNGIQSAVKTSYGYVNTAKVPSFKQMNSYLRNGLENNKKCTSTTGAISNDTSLAEKIRGIVIEDENESLNIGTNHHQEGAMNYYKGMRDCNSISYEDRSRNNSIHSVPNSFRDEKSINYEAEKSYRDSLFSNHATGSNGPNQPEILSNGLETYGSENDLQHQPVNNMLNYNNVNLNKVNSPPGDLSFVNKETTGKVITPAFNNGFVIDSQTTNVAAGWRVNTPPVGMTNNCPNNIGIDTNGCINTGKTTDRRELNNYKEVTVLPTLSQDGGRDKSESRQNNTSVTQNKPLPNYDALFDSYAVYDAVKVNQVQNSVQGKRSFSPIPESVSSQTSSVVKPNREGDFCDNLILSKRVRFMLDKHGNSYHTTHYINKDTHSPIDCPPGYLEMIRGSNGQIHISSDFEGSDRSSEDGLSSAKCNFTEATGEKTDCKNEDTVDNCHAVLQNNGVYFNNDHMKGVYCNSGSEGTVENSRYINNESYGGHKYAKRNAYSKETVHCLPDALYESDNTCNSRSNQNYLNIHQNYTQSSSNNNKLVNNSEISKYQPNVGQNTHSGDRYHHYYPNCESQVGHGSSTFTNNKISPTLQPARAKLVISQAYTNVSDETRSENNISQINQTLNHYDKSHAYFNGVDCAPNGVPSTSVYPPSFSGMVRSQSFNSAINDTFHSGSRTNYQSNLYKDIPRSYSNYENYNLNSEAYNGHRNVGSASLQSENLPESERLINESIYKLSQQPEINNQKSIIKRLLASYKANNYDDRVDSAAVDAKHSKQNSFDSLKSLKTTSSENNINEWLKCNSNTYKYNKLLQHNSTDSILTACTVGSDDNSRIKEILLLDDVDVDNVSIMSTKERLSQLRKAKGPVFASTREICQLLAANRGNPLALNSPYYRHFAESSL